MTVAGTKEIDIIAYLVPKAGMEDALSDAVLAIVPAVRREPGCLSYTPHLSRDRPGMIVMVERWADDAALAAHEKAPPLAGLAARFDELLAEPLRLERLSRIG